MASDHRTPPPEPADSGVEALLAECIELLETDGADAVESLLAQHPEAAAPVRRVLASLEGAGLVGDSPPPLDPDRDDSPGEDPLIDTSLGEYRLLRRLGRGGMGVVYLARQESLHRYVAVKVAHPALAASEVTKERFRREARAVARLRHPNIVTVYGSGEAAGVLFTAMEFVAGDGLDRLIASRHRDVTSATGVSGFGTLDAVRVIRDIARALAYAHGEQVVHRDVKPSNILVREEGRAMLLDFGLAKDASDVTLTVSGAFQGSPHYASPEQIRASGEQIGPSTDIYSLGVTLYEAISGRLPFVGDTTEQLFHQVLSRSPTPIRQHASGISRDLETIVHTAIHRDPSERYRDMAAFADDLDAALTLRPITARRPGPLRRARHWMRDQPVRATVVAMATAAVVLLAGGLAIDRHQADLARRRAAAEAIAGARADLTSYAELRDRAIELESSTARETAAMARRYHSAESWQALDRRERESRTLRLDREALFRRVTRALDRAEQLDRTGPELRDTRLALWIEQWRVAVAHRDDETARFLRERIKDQDERGRYRDELEGFTAQRFISQPDGAEVFVFRYEDLSALHPDGDPRLVPTPVLPERSEHRELPATVCPPPGTWCLRVLRATAPLQPGDLVLEVAGHPIEDTLLVDQGHGPVQRGDRFVMDGDLVVRHAADVDRSVEDERQHGEALPTRPLVFERDGERFAVDGRSLPHIGVSAVTPRRLAERGDVAAVVWRSGQRIEMDLAPGSTLRTTANPLFTTPSTRLGQTPTEVRLAPGSYLALVRKAGFEELRIPIDVARGRDADHRFELCPIGSTPEGFVPIVAPWPNVDTPFWMMDHEVTFEEYLEFLNDPQVRPHVDRGVEPRLVPRDIVGGGPHGHLTLRDDGTFGPPARWRGGFAVFGITYQDATTYARWRSRLKDGWSFHVPSLAEFYAVARPSPERRFVSGDVFRPRWIKSKSATEVLRLEPGLRYPIDELAPGVFDLTGNLRELTRDLAPDGDNVRESFGGAWTYFFPTVFELGHSHASTDGQPTREVGFRLIARRDDG